MKYDDLTDIQTILRAKNEIQQIDKEFRPSEESIKKFRREDKERWQYFRKNSLVRNINIRYKNYLIKQNNCVLQTRYQFQKRIIWGCFPYKISGACLALWWASEKYLILFQFSENSRPYEYRVLKSKSNYEKFMKQNDVKLISCLYNNY